MKSPQMEAFLDQMSNEMFGRKRDGKACVTCGSSKIKSEDFKDDLSRKEFTIAHMCQSCQDSVFDDQVHTSNYKYVPDPIWLCILTRCIPYSLLQHSYILPFISNRSRLFLYRIWDTLLSQ